MKKVLTTIVCVLALAGAVRLGFPPSAYVQPSGVVAVITSADVTGDGAAHALPAGSARWVQFVCPPSNSSTAVRIGDSAVSSTRGIPVAAGAGFMLPPIPSAPTMKVQDQYYQLSSLYYLAASGDKVSILWGR